MKRGHNKELHLCEYKSGAASSKSKRVFSCTCSLNREEHKAIIVLTTWISKCVVEATINYVDFLSNYTKGRFKLKDTFHYAG